jgi:catechol 2,3-dioxygenase-like lactoylglutathione lyase family enzyme
MGSIWHIGIAVPGLEEGKKELSDVFGLRWRPARVRKLTLVNAAGAPYEVECHVAFSRGGPFAVEVWQAIPGTPLDVPEAGGVHHIGYWVDDLAAEAKTARRARLPRLRHGRHHAAAEPGTCRHPHRTVRPAQRPPVAARPVPARVRVRGRPAARCPHRRFSPS